MRLFAPSFRLSASLLLAVLGAPPPSSVAQVSPAEIRDPQLKPLENAYLQDLIKLNRQVCAENFPFPFVLSRYVDQDPKEQAGTDTRGLEFVSFHDRTILKFSGNYNAAFSGRKLTPNQRADRVFSDVVMPMLRLFPQYFSENSGFDGVGFEISYHVSEASGKAEYEGRENLVVVMSLGDALRFPKLTGADEKQQVLNASEVYVSGQRFGLALGQVDQLPLGAMAPPHRTGQYEQSSIDSEGKSLIADSRHPDLDFHVPSVVDKRPDLPGAPAHVPSMADPLPLTPADVDSLQAKYQSALDDFSSFVDTTMHETNSSAPSLALFRNSLYLQLTLQNPQTFDKDKTSLYKRAALSFDLFLAPHLADLSTRIPAITNLRGLDITVLVSVSSSSSPSEAVEFICPLQALRSFASYDISNQDLINQGMVIVNGVRISLDLQQVE
jgi:hypothetical protein